MSHTTVYIEALAICILFLALLYGMNLRYGRPEHFGCLGAVYLLTMLTSLLDIIWILIDGAARYVYIAYPLHILYLSAFLLSTLFWFAYCQKQYPFRILGRRLLRILFYLPAAAVLLLILTSPFTGLIYYIDESYRYVRGPLYSLLSVSYVYLLVAAACAAIAARGAQLSTQKNQYHAMIGFTLPPILLGVLSVIAPPGSLPTMQFSILLSLLLVFVQMQNRRITNDSLTGIANRFGLDLKLQECINHKRETDASFFLFIGDVDHFKALNDTHGHVAGDDVLRDIAKTVADTAEGYGAFVARMGGDEFAIVLDSEKAEIAEDLKAAVAAALADPAHHHGHSISMCLGYAPYQSGMTLTNLMDAADRKLYDEKRARPKT